MYGERRSYSESLKPDTEKRNHGLMGEVHLVCVGAQTKKQHTLKIPQGCPQGGQDNMIDSKRHSRRIGPQAVRRCDRKNKEGDAEKQDEMGLDPHNGRRERD